MKVVNGFLLVLMLFILSAGISGPARADAPKDEREKPLVYTIKAGDTLYLVATQYYNAPSAASAIFYRNRNVLLDACSQNLKNAPAASEKKADCGPSTIYPDTRIELPYILESPKRLMYERRRTPLARNVAEQVARAKEVTLESLGDISRANQNQSRSGAQASPPPKVVNQAVISKAFGTAAHRESTPPWYSAPSGNLHKCAKAVCDQFKTLCYFECLAIAKRIGDGNSACNARSIPEELPYQLDADDPDRCSAFMPQ